MPDQNGDEVDANLVHQPEIDALLNDVRPGDGYVLVPSDVLCLPDCGLQTVGDKGKGRIPVFSNPLLGKISVREHHHRRADRVPTAPTVGVVEESPPGDKATTLRKALPDVAGAGLRGVKHPRGTSCRHFDLSVEVPVKEVVDTVIPVCDEA